MNKLNKLNPDTLPMMADVLKAIGHPHRLRLLEALADGERSVGDLAATLDLPQAIVSQQLRIMRTSQVVCVRRLGTLALYSLAHTGLLNLLSCLVACQSRCQPLRPPSPKRHPTKEITS